MMVLKKLHIISIHCVFFLLVNLPLQSLAFNQTNTKQTLQDTTSASPNGGKAISVKYMGDQFNKTLILEQQLLQISSQRNLAVGVNFVLVGLLCLSILLFYRAYLKRNSKHQQEKKLLLLAQKHISQLELDKVKLENQFREKELSGHLENLSRKNDFLQSIRDQIDALDRVTTEKAKRPIQKLNQLIDYDLRKDEEWDAFLQSFQSFNTVFLEKLNQKVPNMTPNDLRIASLMKMDLSTKEIAHILNISPQGVKKARYRLRKKLEIDSNINVQDFLMELA